MKKLRLLLPVAIVITATCDSPLSPGGCDVGTAYTLGSSTDASFSSDDCNLGTENGDAYDFTVTSQQTVKFQATGSKAVMRLINNSPSVAGEGLIAVEGGSGPNMFHVVLPPGNYSLETYPEVATAGPYTLSSTVFTPPEPAGCLTANPNRRFLLVRGANVGGGVATGDCVTPNPDNRTYDAYLTQMVVGKTYKFTITASMGLLVTLIKDGAEVTRQSQTAAGTIVITYVATASATHLINLLGTPSGTLGTYTIKLE